MSNLRIPELKPTIHFKESALSETGICGEPAPTGETFTFNLKYVTCIKCIELANTKDSTVHFRSSVVGAKNYCGKEGLHSTILPEINCECCLNRLSAYDPVNKPLHYTAGRIEVIDFIEDQKLNYHLGNAVKYIARAGKKDPAKKIEDLQKAVWYLNRYIDNELQDTKRD